MILANFELGENENMDYLSLDMLLPAIANKMGLELSSYYKWLYDTRQVLEKLDERLTGRFPLEIVKHPETKEILATPDKMISESDAKKIMDSGIKGLYVRSVLGCRCKHGACRKCYGMGLATRELVNMLVTKCLDVTETKVLFLEYCHQKICHSYQMVLQ